MTFSSIFAIIIGLGMIGQWTMSFITKGIPELETEPIRIWFHISGELVTALALLISGIGLLVGWSWAPILYLVASGMLIYTAIVSPGYFAQQGKRFWVIFFFVLLIITTVSILSVATGMII